MPNQNELRQWRGGVWQQTSCVAQLLCLLPSGQWQKHHEAAKQVRLGTPAGRTAGMPASPRYSSSALLVK